MDLLHLERCCKQRLHQAHPDVIHLLDTAIDGAELAVLAAVVGDTLLQIRIDSPALLLGFRAAVRDRYRELAQGHVALGR